MADYRRWFVPGGTYFFTVVSYQRRKFLTEAIARESLRHSIRAVRSRFPFTLVAVVLLPDHLHTVWCLPRGDSDYPMRWKRIKEEFTKSYLSTGGTELPITESRKKKGERGIWQRRYWEHTVRDEEDLTHCVDYIHWNPKKHGYVKRVRDWAYSSFHRFVQEGEYDIDWGSSDPTSELNHDWGE